MSFLYASSNISTEYTMIHPGKDHIRRCAVDNYWTFVSLIIKDHPLPWPLLCTSKRHSAHSLCPRASLSVDGVEEYVLWSGTICRVVLCLLLPFDVFWLRPHGCSFRRLIRCTFLVRSFTRRKLILKNRIVQTNGQDLMTTFLFSPTSINGRSNRFMTSGITVVSTLIAHHRFLWIGSMAMMSG